MSLLSIRKLKARSAVGAGRCTDWAPVVHFQADNDMSLHSTPGNEHTIALVVRMIDDGEMAVNVTKKMLGSELLHQLCSNLEIEEEAYFGLRFVDKLKQRYWLDTTKEVLKQLKDLSFPPTLYFRVKFYPIDLSSQMDDVVSYYTYLQLKRDLYRGRLLSSTEEFVHLASLIAQVELGDFNTIDSDGSYTQFLGNPPPMYENLGPQIAELHKTWKGMDAESAEQKFLITAQSLVCYGIDPHLAMDDMEESIHVCLSPSGIRVMKQSQDVSFFPWNEVLKVINEDKTLKIHTMTNEKKNIWSCKFSDSHACMHFWTCACEHISFYGSEGKKVKLTRKSGLLGSFRRKKFSFSGRNQKQIAEESGKKVSKQKSTALRRTQSTRLSLSGSMFSTEADGARGGSVDGQSTAQADSGTPSPGSHTVTVPEIQVAMFASAGCGVEPSNNELGENEVHVHQEVAGSPASDVPLETQPPASVESSPQVVATVPPSSVPLLWVFVAVLLALIAVWLGRRV